MDFAFPDDLARHVSERWESFASRTAQPPPLPAWDDLRHILATAFFASLEREEGRPVRFVLCCSPDVDVLRDGFGIKNVEKFINGAADDEAMVMQQMQQQQEAEAAMAAGQVGPDGEPMAPEQAASPQLSGGPQPDAPPGVAPETPEPTIQGVPEASLKQIQEQYGLLGSV